VPDPSLPKKQRIKEELDPADLTALGGFVYGVSSFSGILMRWSLADGSAQYVDPDGSDYCKSGSGAAWTIGPEVYFSCNNEGGVYLYNTEDFAAGPVDKVMVRKVGKSKATKDNDGLVCPNVKTPGQWNPCCAKKEHRIETYEKNWRELLAKIQQISRMQNQLGNLTALDLCTTTTTTTTDPCEETRPVCEDKPVVVTDFPALDCCKITKPMQAYFIGNGKCSSFNDFAEEECLDAEGNYGFHQLDAKTGQYFHVFSASRRLGFHGLNACAVGPKDHIVYCIADVRGCHEGKYLVRISSERIDYIMKTKFSYAAAFSDDDIFVYYNQWETWGKPLRNMYLIRDVSSLKGFNAGKTEASQCAARAEAAQVDLSEKFELKPPPPAPPAEWGRRKRIRAELDPADLTVLGKYVYGVASFSGKLLRISLSDGSAQYVEPASEHCKSGSGAAWTIGDEIYFSCNREGGVFKYSIEQFDLAAPVEKVSVSRVGESRPASDNDGLVCPGLRTPPTWNPRCKDKN